MDIFKVAGLFYPIMVAQLMGEISESKASELVGMNIESYRSLKAAIARSVLRLLEELPSPLTLLLDATREKPASSAARR